MNGEFDFWKAIRGAALAGILAGGLSCTRQPAGLDAANGGRPEPVPGSGPDRGSLPTADVFAPKRQAMVENLRQTFKEQKDFPGMAAALEVMRRVPRHEFVQPRWRSRAYEVHSPLPIEEEQTISAPDIVAIMTGALDLKNARRVLEIGTGSGYQAAILGELVPEVYTIEIRPGLAESARQKIQELKAQGILGGGKIEVVVGDGYKGYASMAPYDAIVVTAAPKEVPVHLLNQLKEGGRMVIPVGEYFQQLQVIERQPGGVLSPKTLLPVRFVPMVDEKEARRSK